MFKSWFDLDAVTNALEKNNIKVLYNSNTKIKINKKEIFIAGLQYNGHIFNFKSPITKTNQFDKNYRNNYS